MPKVTVGQENNADIDIYYEDHAVLVGHSMGTGEVTRYLGSYGSGRVRPGRVGRCPGVDEGFLDNFYNIDTLRGTLISEQAYQASWNLAVTASATAAVACVSTWQTGFRADLPKIDVPVLVVQGNADQVLPFDKTGERLPALIKDVQLVIIEGGPHAIAWTHADQVNTALLGFIRN